MHLEDGIKLGEDVLVDVLAISKCCKFIHTLSNLALAVSYINPNIEMLLIE